jgi:ketosteroid isomerase-like protein
MSDPRRNLDRLKAAYQLWHESGGQDASKWVDLAADDISMFSLAQGATPEMEFSRPASGPGTLARYLEALQRDWELLAMVPTEFVVDADGERIVMFGTGQVRFRRSGKVAESPLVHYWRFQDGKAVEFREYYDTAGAFAAAAPNPA